MSPSSSKTEYRSMHWVVAELTWLKHILSEISALSSFTILVYSDTQVYLHITCNLLFHEWTKHVDLDCHFVQQQFLNGPISLNFVPLFSITRYIYQIIVQPTSQLNSFQVGGFFTPLKLEGGCWEYILTIWNFFQKKEEHDRHVHENE